MQADRGRRLPGKLVSSFKYIGDGGNCSVDISPVPLGVGRSNLLANAGRFLGGRYRLCRTVQPGQDVCEDCECRGEAGKVATAVCRG
jgi:hypothetical protein